jgi:hypothetical protein
MAQGGEIADEPHVGLAVGTEEATALLNMVEDVSGQADGAGQVEIEAAQVAGCLERRDLPPQKHLPHGVYGLDNCHQARLPSENHHLCHRYASFRALTALAGLLGTAPATR